MLRCRRDILLIALTLLFGCSTGEAGGSPDERVWGPTTTPFDSECASDCEVIAAEEFGHAGDLTLAYNPDVDDSIAKWGDCLESFKACITGGGAARTCSEQSSCPETCRTEYESSLGATSGLEEELEAFEAVYIVAGAPCRPSGDEATP